MRVIPFPFKFDINPGVKLPVVALLFFACPIFSQPALSDTEKLVSLCKVWGFLKYHHPEVAKGSMDWDQALADQMERVKAADSPDALSGIYLSWIKGLGQVKPCKKCAEPLPPEVLTYNLDTGWIRQDRIFSDSLKRVLLYIRDNRNQGDNQYVFLPRSVGNANFDGEKPYVDMPFPSETFRLLGLFRYWNCVNYFYPYKYVIGEDWSQVLNDMIPVFREANDTLAYHLALKELAARLNDSHAGVVTPYTKRYYGTLKPPCALRIIDGQVVASGFYNDSLARADDIRPGDVFLKAGGVAVKEIIERRWKYIPGSNLPAKWRNLSGNVLNGPTDTVTVVINREGKELTKVIHRYPAEKFQFLPERGPVFDILSKRIGYLNMGLVDVDAVDSIMSRLVDLEAIIFDVRNYPRGTLNRVTAWLTKGFAPYAKFTRPVPGTPGLFEWDRPNHCGSKNKKHFTGKIVLLVNDITISHAEITCMALQTAPNVTCIGSQTAGADGNVSTVTFPGGYETWITGIGVFYPDGRATQRTGIVPDIVAKPTIEGIREGRDEVLERAVRFIKTGK